MLVFYKLLHNGLLSFVLSLTGVGQPVFLWGLRCWFYYGGVFWVLIFMGFDILKLLSFYFPFGLVELYYTQGEWECQGGEGCFGDFRRN